jgi:TRAP-type C4-dicarboxylate transport system permease small subunit
MKSLADVLVPAALIFAMWWGMRLAIRFWRHRSLR